MPSMKERLSSIAMIVAKIPMHSSQAWSKSDLLVTSCSTYTAEASGPRFQILDEILLICGRCVGGQLRLDQPLCRRPSDWWPTWSSSLCLESSLRMHPPSRHLHQVWNQWSFESCFPKYLGDFIPIHRATYNMRKIDISPMMTVEAILTSIDAIKVI